MAAGPRVIAAAGAALAAAVVMGGCGSSQATRSATPSATTTHETARVIGTPSARGSTARYGTPPAWLPRARVRVGRVVTATPSHPWLAIEGDTVAVRLATGRAMMTSVGPSVPRQGRVAVPTTSPCRFVVTFAAIRGTIPLRAGAFSLLGEDGATHRVQVTLRGGAALPARVTAGHPLTLTLTAVLPTGNGQLRWAPVGSRPTASWDFDVEID